MTTIDPERYAQRQPAYQKTNDLYLLPNDEREIERLTHLYEAYEGLTQGRLIFVPDFVPPTKIIDVGCGIGTVVRRLARTYPDAITYGIDLSMYPPEQSDVELPNLSFIQGDIMKLAGTDPRLQWNSVDFVWSRLLVCGLNDWPGYIARALSLLKPGCWAQMSDFCEDVYFHPDKSSRPQGYQAKNEMGWLKALRAGGKQKGLDVDAGRNINGYMKQAGFVDVQTIEIEIPFWRSVLAQKPHLKVPLDHFINDPYALWWHMVARMVENMGCSQEQIKQWQLDSRKDLGEEYGKYMTLWITIGRKPSSSRT